MPITATIRGLETLKPELQKLAPEALRLAILRMSQQAYDYAQNAAGKHNKTGALFRSLYNRQVIGGREVGHDLRAAPHAVFVHWGTRAHTIRPKTRKALRWSAGGRFVFAKQVRHPGYAGDAWMVRAADEAVRNFSATITQAFRDADK
jgi:hypothetical protein